MILSLCFLFEIENGFWMVLMIFIVIIFVMLCELIFGIIIMNLLLLIFVSVVLVLYRCFSCCVICVIIILFIECFSVLLRYLKLLILINNKVIDFWFICVWEMFCNMWLCNNMWFGRLVSWLWFVKWVICVVSVIDLVIFWNIIM